MRAAHVATRGGRKHIGHAPHAVAQCAEGTSMYLFNDSHVHLTNYVQEGPRLEEFVALMGDVVGRATLFGIPLQQEWSYRISGPHAPTYYLQTDAPLYYY